jgi:hypothetical protein
MFADVFDLGLELHRRIHDEVHRDCWKLVIVDSLKQPLLYKVVTSDAPWWPDLQMFFAQRPELVKRSAEPEGDEAAITSAEGHKLVEEIPAKGQDIGRSEK